MYSLSEPGKVTSLQVDTEDPRKISIEWHSPAGIVGTYHLEIYKYDGKWLFKNSRLIQDCKHIVYDLDPGYKYKCEVWNVVQKVGSRRAVEEFIVSKFVNDYGKGSG